jgi:WD40 repeat protein
MLGFDLKTVAMLREKRPVILVVSLLLLATNSCGLVNNKVTVASKKSVSAHGAGISELVYIDDNKKLVSYSFLDPANKNGQTIKLWDVESMKLLKECKVSAKVLMTGMAPCLNGLLVCLNDGTILAYDNELSRPLVITDRLQRELAGTKSNGAGGIKVSRSNKYVAVLADHCEGDYTEAYIFSHDNGQKSATLIGKLPASAIAFHPDSDFLFALSNSGNERQVLQYDLGNFDAKVICSCERDEWLSINLISSRRNSREITLLLVNDERTAWIIRCDNLGNLLSSEFIPGGSIGHIQSPVLTADSIWYCGEHCVEQYIIDTKRIKHVDGWYEQWEPFVLASTPGSFCLGTSKGFLDLYCLDRK